MSLSKQIKSLEKNKQEILNLIAKLSLAISESEKKIDNAKSQASTITDSVNNATRQAENTFKDLSFIHDIARNTLRNLEKNLQMIAEEQNSDLFESSKPNKHKLNSDNPNQMFEDILDQEVNIKNPPSNQELNSNPVNTQKEYLDYYTTLKKINLKK